MFSGEAEFCHSAAASRGLIAQWNIDPKAERPVSVVSGIGLFETVVQSLGQTVHPVVAPQIQRRQNTVFCNTKDEASFLDTLTQQI